MMSATKPARSQVGEESHNYWLVRQIAVNTGLVCGWSAAPPEALTTRKLMRGIEHIAEIENGSYGQFDKSALYGLAQWANGVNVAEHKHRVTSGELRALLAKWAGFEWDGSDSTQTFRKPELQQLLMAAAYQDFKEDNR